jgi:HK97 family phage portal protein
MGIIRSLQTRGYGKPPLQRYQQNDPNPPIVGSYWSTSLTGIWEDRPWYQLVDANRGWVYTAIDKIAKSIAMIPLELFVYRNKVGKKIDSPGFKAELKSFRHVGHKKQFLKDMNLDEEPVLDHPFLDLIHKPNNYFTRFDFWYHTMVRLELGGICNWLLIKDKLGVPRIVHTLPLTKFARLRPKVSVHAELEGWHYEDGEVFIDFAPEDMVSIRYAHAASPWQGYGALQAQTFAYDIDLFLSEQQRAFFKNGASLGLLLGTDQQLGDKQVKQLQREIQDQYTGAMKAGGTLITHSGLKAQKMGTTARDSSIKDISDLSREKILTAFDLSDGAVGLVHDVNRANMEGLRENFVMDCLKPKTMLIEESLEQFLLPQYDPALTLEFALPFMGNEEFRLSEITSHLKSGYTSINEERQKDGLDPVDWGEKPFIPTTVQQWTGEKEQPAVSAPGGDGSDLPIEEGDDSYAESMKAEEITEEPHDEKDLHIHEINDLEMEELRQVVNPIIERVIDEGKRIFNKYHNGECQYQK